MKNGYTRGGVSLLAAGILVLASSYLVFELTWLSALGLSLVILGAILLTLARTIPRLSPELGNLLFQTGRENLNRLIEELNIKSRALYLPPGLTGGRAQALLPLDSQLPQAQELSSLPSRFIVRYGTSPAEVGLLVTTPGTAALGMLKSSPAPTATELESALTTLLVGSLGAADGIRVTADGNKVGIEVTNPRMEEPGAVRESLGSSLASIAATLAASAWDRPVTIKGEGQKGRRYSIQLEVME